MNWSWIKRLAGSKQGGESSGIFVTYDSKIDAAYINLREIENGGVDHTYPCDPREVHGEINLDFDNDGRLIEIEVLDAKGKLPSTVIANAVKLG